MIYIIPIIVFLSISISIYILSNSKDKNEPSNIFIRNILPAIVLSILVFYFIKYKDHVEEPMMFGNYFDVS